MSDILTGTEAKQQISKTLVEFLKKNTDGIRRLLEREAKGMAKLEKSLKKDESGGVLPDLGKASGCKACGGSNMESLGSHLGMDHTLCKECGEVGASKGMTKAEPAKNPQDQLDEEEKKRKAYADLWAAQDEKKKKDDVQKGEPKLEKKLFSPSENADWGRKHMQRYDGRGPLGDYTAASIDAGLRGEKDPNSFAPDKNPKIYGRKNSYKAELPPNAPKPQTVENVRQGAGMAGGIPKMPSVKKTSIPKGITPKAKDAFNTGGMNPTTLAAMGKAELEKNRVDSTHSAINRDNMKTAQKKVSSASSPAAASWSSMHSAAADAKLRGESNPNSFAPGGTYKSEMTPAKPAKTPFNTGAGNSGKPSREIPASDTAVQSAREGAAPPPENGGKVVEAPGSGGEIKKEELNKNFFGLPIAAPPPNPKATAHVKAMRERAAQKHAGGGSLKPIRAGFDPGITKWKDQQARDVHVVGKMMADKTKHDAKQARIAGATSAPAPAAAMGKAEGIPEAPKAANAATQTQTKPAAAAPAPAPTKQSPAL